MEDRKTVCSTPHYLSQCNTCNVVCQCFCLQCIVSASLSIYSALCLPVCLFTVHCICQSAYLQCIVSACLSVYIGLCLPVCLFTVHCVCLSACLQYIVPACLQCIVSACLLVYSVLCLPVCLLILRLFPLAWFPPFFFPDFPVIVIAQVPPLPPSSPPPGGETGWKVVSLYHQQLDTNSSQKRYEYDGWVVIYQMDGAAFLDSNLSFQCKKTFGSFSVIMRR